jgi:hypothetical protein
VLHFIGEKEANQVVNIAERAVFGGIFLRKTAESLID